MSETAEEAHARRLRLAGIADRHMEKLANLPFNDRFTVALSLVGLLVMQVSEDQQLPLLDHVAKGLREYIAIEGGA